MSEIGQELLAIIPFALHLAAALAGTLVLFGGHRYAYAAIRFQAIALGLLFIFLGAAVIGVAVIVSGLLFTYLFRRWHPGTLAEDGERSLAYRLVFLTTAVFAVLPIFLEPLLPILQENALFVPFDMLAAGVALAVAFRPSFAPLAAMLSANALFALGAAAYPLTGVIIYAAALLAAIALMLIFLVHPRSTGTLVRE